MAVPNVRKGLTEKIVGGYDVALRERVAAPGGTWSSDVGQGPTTSTWNGQINTAMRERESAITSNYVFGGLVGPLATTAASIAGQAGTWGPQGSVPALDPASMVGKVTATPGTAWQTGSYMQTQVSGAAGRAYWNGTAWIAGTAP